MLQHAFDNGVGAFTMEEIIFCSLSFIWPAISFADCPLPVANSALSSSISSAFTSEKLLTKLSGFCIPWAMPAVSSPGKPFFRVDELGLGFL
jgi:hypothetical protein